MSTFWSELTNTVGRIADTNPPGYVTWAITSALDTLERLHDDDRLSLEYQATATKWFTDVETLGLARALPFPLLASDPSSERDQRIANSLIDPAIESQPA